MKTHTLLLILVTAAGFLLGGISDGNAETLGSRVLLLGIENVRDELELTSAQRASLDRLRTSYRKEAQPIVAARTPEAQTQFQQVTKKYDQRALAVLTPAQKSELGSILHKVHGAWMLTSPEVQTQLALTPKQIANIKKRQLDLEAFTDKVNAEAYEGKITPQQRITKLRNYRMKMVDRMERSLTKEQRAVLTAIQQGKCPCPTPAGATACPCPPKTCPSCVEA